MFEIHQVYIFVWCIFCYRHGIFGFLVSHSLCCCCGLCLSPFPEEVWWQQAGKVIINESFKHPVNFIFFLINLLIILISTYCSNGKKKRLVTLKKPMLVKGPLGIVSGTELAFLIMFMALLIWSFSVYLLNGFSNITPQSAAKKGLKE